ncbi:MAG TPA: DUF5655 domain-containing protein [Saprospiraceae bacterium]|nr:DUF5655 domain-containing protein [Saprospiraceae bacterium]
MSIYSVHPSIAYQQAIIRNLKETTGKTIEEWEKLLRQEAWKDAKFITQYLINEYHLGRTKASLISDYALKIQLEDISESHYLKMAPLYVEKMYFKKESILQIHQSIINYIRSLNDETKICPCRTLVPLYRHHVYAQLKPTTKTRIDFGFALKKYTKELPSRLEPTGGLEKGDRITHRIRIEKLEDFDSEVRQWIKIAYDLDQKN